MKRNLSDYFVAVFVIACSVVLLGALAFALSGRQLKKPTRTLQINYEDVTGIKVNSELRYAGAPAGLRRFAFDLDGLPPGASPKGATLRLTAATDEAAIEVTATPIN